MVQNNPDILRILLVCHVGAEIGVGHLSRLLALAQELNKIKSITLEFLVFGDLIKKSELFNFKIHNFPLTEDFVTAVERTTMASGINAVIFDVYPKANIVNFDSLLARLKQFNVYLISIDSLIEYCNILNLICIPSFYFDRDKHSSCTSILKSGWDSFLIQKRFQHRDWTPGSKVLVLTGGSDTLNLGKTLPIQLDKLLDGNTEVHWVRGPFSNSPEIPKKCRLRWIVHNAPEQLDELMVQSNYIITVFGVSFFEALQYGVPTVVFSPYGDKDKDELSALSKEDVAMVVNNSEFIVEHLINLMNNDKLAKKYSINALNKMSINGAQSLSKEIYSFINLK